LTEYEKSDTKRKWRLFQYVSPNGRKAIDDWRKSLPVGPPQVFLDTFLRDMVKKEVWEPPDLAPLHGKQAGLNELRWKCGNVQHRILGCKVEEHRYLMLLGCTHKGKSYDPPDSLNTVLVRHKQIKDGEASIDEYQLILDR
jgi:hypothetical protein